MKNMFKCTKCEKELNHLNNEFWICESCNKIIEIPVTKNWENKTDNRFYEHIFENRDTAIITHEIGVKLESRENYFEFICGD